MSAKARRWMNPYPTIRVAIVSDTNTIIEKDCHGTVEAPREKIDRTSLIRCFIDTASYSNLRRMVTEGARVNDIPAGAIRIEEVLNYFDYDYADLRTGDLFGVTSQIADCPWNPDTKLLFMGFSTEPIDYADTAGANLVLLIDTSGSMDSPDELPLLQDSFAELTDGPTERERVSIVTYSEPSELYSKALQEPTNARSPAPSTACAPKRRLNVCGGRRRVRHGTARL